MWVSKRLRKALTLLKKKRWCDPSKQLLRLTTNSETKTVRRWHSKKNKPKGQSRDTDTDIDTAQKTEDPCFRPAENKVHIPTEEVK
jgi:hypothetical protein